MLFFQFIVVFSLFLSIQSFHISISKCRNIHPVSMSLTDFREELFKTASKIATPGKGVMAVDESTGTIAKRFKSINVENNEANRRDYRELLFTTPNIGNYISAAILFEETLNHSSKSGKKFVDILLEQGIVPGIKVDAGLQQLPGGDSIETCIKGIDGLKERAASYYSKGARFAKWRAVFQITDKCPTPLSLQENSWGLARYARTVQESGLVPIVEPEILMDGNHTIERTAEVQEHVLSTVYKALIDNGVFLEGTLLKPSMTCPGSECPEKASIEKIAEFTVRTLERTVPPSVPGITFLSGGLSEEDSSLYLNAMNKIQRKGPWTLSFSYGRALQQSCLRTWLGKAENIEAAQKSFLARAIANSEASLGKYSPGSQPSFDGTLFVKGYKY